MPQLDSVLWRTSPGISRRPNYAFLRCSQDVLWREFFFGWGGPVYTMNWRANIRMSCRIFRRRPVKSGVKTGEGRGGGGEQLKNSCTRKNMWRRNEQTEINTGKLQRTPAVSRPLGIWHRRIWALTESASLMSKSDVLYWCKFESWGRPNSLTCASI